MSPRRYGPSRRIRTTLDLLPRTKVHTPRFLSGASMTLLIAGWAMVAVEIPSGDLTPATLAGYRAGGWTSLVLGAFLGAAAFAQERRSVARAAAAAAGSPDAWTLDHSWTPGLARDHAAAASCSASRA